MRWESGRAGVLFACVRTRISSTWAARSTLRKGRAADEMCVCAAVAVIRTIEVEGLRLWPHVRVLAGALEGNTFIGRKAQEFRGLLKIKYPIEHGIVTDWDDMERIWNWVYTEELGTLSEEVCHPATLLYLILNFRHYSILCC